ncbi:MAG: ribosomal protein S18-alanine N-acetyltransferase [Porcipelethomonas sp.]
MKLKADVLAARPAQAAAIAGIEKQCIPGGWSEKSFLEAMKQENSVFLSAVSEGVTVGFINGSVVSDEAEIMNIAVLPEYRHNGFADKLIGRFCAEAKEKGAQKVFLEVREMNSPARKLYEKHGFEICGKRKGYYREPSDNAIIMMKNIKDGD